MSLDHQYLGTRTASTVQMASPDSGGDFFQAASILVGGKLLQPGVGSHFKRFWRVRKTAVYTLGPNEKLSVSDCVPKFTVTDGDFTIPGNETSAIAPGTAPQYRPKWAYGMIFLLMGLEMADKTLNPVETVAPGAFGPENCTTSIPHLHHTYELRGAVVNTAFNHSNPRIKLGSLFPNAAERNTWATVTGQITQSGTTDNTAINTFPPGGTVNISQNEF
jgi:hypothetical protein